MNKCQCGECQSERQERDTPTYDELEQQLIAMRERAEKAEYDFRIADANFQEERNIVTRIWEAVGNPTYESLGGKSIYDLIVDYKQCAESAEQRNREAMERKPVGYVRAYGVDCLCGLLFNETTQSTPLPASTTIDPYPQDDTDIPLYTESIPSHDIAELQREVAEADALRERMSKILSDTAIELKGPEPELSNHSWHDLADVAAQLTRKLTERQREVEELRAWKQSAMDTTPDYQAIGRLLGVRLGDSVHDKILPALQKLTSENAELRKDAERYRWVCRNANVIDSAPLPKVVGDFLNNTDWLNTAIDAAMQQEKQNVMDK